MTRRAPQLRSDTWSACSLRARFFVPGMQPFSLGLALTYLSFTLPRYVSQPLKKRITSSFIIIRQVIYENVKHRQLGLVITEVLSTIKTHAGQGDPRIHIVNPRKVLDIPATYRLV